MRKYIKGWHIQLVCVFLILFFSFLYLNASPRTNSWLHEEQMLDGRYKIGRIDLWLNGIENVSVPVSLSAFAPTRFFQTGADRDANFDMAVNPYQIIGANKGDIDIKIDLSCEDENSTNYSIFYIFVPTDTQDEDFLAGRYRDYLDGLFIGYTLTTNAQRKAAMNSINTDTLNDYKGVVLPKDAQEPIYYLLVWSEYDNIANITGTSYVSVSYPITVKAYSYQLYY